MYIFSEILTACNFANVNIATGVHDNLCNLIDNYRCQDMITCCGFSPTRRQDDGICSFNQLRIKSIDMLAHFIPSWGRSSISGAGFRLSMFPRTQCFESGTRYFSRSSGLREESASTAPFKTKPSEERNTSAM